MLRERVSQLEKSASSVLCGVGRLNTMVEMNLNLTPPLRAVLGQAGDQGVIVLLGRVEIGMTQGAPIGITPASDRLRILRAPPLDTLLLLLEGRVRPGYPRTSCRFTVIGSLVHAMNAARAPG